MQYLEESPRHRPGGFPITSSSSTDHDDVTNGGLDANARKSKRLTYTVEDAIESIGLGWFQAKIFVVGKMIAAADAMEMMLLAVLSPLVRCEWQLSDIQVAFITTAVFVGMGISAPILGKMGDKYGRKVILVMVTSCIGYFGFLTTFVPSYGWLLFLRALVGVGMGGSAHGFSLNAEYVPSKYRAKLLIFGTVFWTIGTLFEITLAMTIVPSMGWRWLLACSAIPVIITGCGLYWIPESARYLVAAGFVDHAKNVLKDAARLNNKKLPQGRLVRSPELVRGRLKDLFSREYLRSTLQMWVLWFGVAFTYYGMVLANAEVLRIRNQKDESHCKCAYLTTSDYVTMMLSTLGELISLPINWLLIDRFGRRITGGVCYIGTALFFVLIQLDVGLSMLTFLMFWVRAFSSASFNFVYIYSSELYPTSIRTLGMGICSANARIGAMLTPFVAQVMLSYSISMATWVYGILCLICGVCAFLLPIETKGRALPQSIDGQDGSIEMDIASNFTDLSESEPGGVTTISGNQMNGELR